MILHYKGKYNLDPNSLPHGEHKANAQPFKEAKSTKEMAIIANAGGVIITIIFALIAFYRCGEYFSAFQFLIGWFVSMLILFPHEILHAICFKEDVYLYTNFKQGLLFVVGPESMTKGRFIFMSLLPNVVFGLIPYVIAMIYPQCVFLATLGFIAIGMGFGDYYNVFNALTQMPKGSLTYLYKFNSYWYIPEKI